MPPLEFRPYLVVRGDALVCSPNVTQLGTHLPRGRGRPSAQERGTGFSPWPLQGQFAVVASVDLCQLGRVGRTGCGKGSADFLHEAQRACWAPRAEHMNRLIGGVGEGMPDTSGSEDEGASGRGFGIGLPPSHGERSAEDVDRFVEVVVDVSRGPGEARRHG